MWAWVAFWIGLFAFLTICVVEASNHPSPPEPGKAAFVQSCIQQHKDFQEDNFDGTIKYQCI